MWKDENLQSLSVFIAPCASRVVTQDGVEHGADEDCVWSQKEVENYFGTYNVLIYHNIQEFQQDKYGEDSIQRKSVLHKHFMVSNAAPTWTMTNI